MAYVKKLEWLCKEAKEAEVSILVGTDHELICFAHPCNLEIGDQVQELFSLNMSNVQKKQEDGCRIVSMHSNKYLLSGRVKQLAPVLIEVYDVTVLGDALPGDIKIGDYVDFVCDRLDI